MVFIKEAASVLALTFIFTTSRATDLDTIGVTALRAADPSLTGDGVQVAQPEMTDSGLVFEVNPEAVGVGAKFFTYRSNAGLGVTFPNKVGEESDHANTVAGNFYGTGGVAPGAAHAANYESVYFYNSIIKKRSPLRAVVVNQSFIVNDDPTTCDKRYDQYISRYGRIFVSGVGNGGGIATPASCVNGIGVGAYGGATSSGPTGDGRSKPELVAPAEFTSFAAPQVAGAATLLVQAGRRFGRDASSAIDSRTVKVLLMNGAKKPGGWAPPAGEPLDRINGAGVLNVFRSYQQLMGGRHAPARRTTEPLADTHLPPPLSPTFSALLGWDVRSASSNGKRDGTNDYFFDSNGGKFAATLAWNRHGGADKLSNLDLFLWKADGTLVASSQSSLGNIEHIFVSNLAAGRYDVQVIKRGGTESVYSQETYALAWSFGQP